MRLRQLIFRSKLRFKVKQVSKSPALRGKPQRKGICTRVYITAPKKPNSARRAVAQVVLWNRVSKIKKFKFYIKDAIIVYIPGENQNLQRYGSILIRGGRVRDLPGVKYKALRGVLSLESNLARRQGRSKYGTKNWFKKSKVRYKAARK